MEGNVVISSRPQSPRDGRQPSAAWSRRRFVAEGLLALATAPALARAGTRSAAEHPPGLSATDNPAGPAGSGGSGAVRSATTDGDRLTTTVRINGRGPYHFLVDTGAERTLIAEDVAARLALPRGREVMVEGIIRGAPAPLVAIDRLDLGGLVCRHLEVPVLPRAMLQADGYLGLDVLDHHRVIFDFRAGTLTVTRPQGFFASLWTRGDEAVVRTLGSSGRLRATNCRVDGVPAAAFVDTGAEMSVINPALYAVLRRRAPTRQVVLGRAALYGVTGGSMAGVVTNIDDIKLGDLDITYTTLVVAPLEVFAEWGLGRRPALLFGMDCLRRFARVSIDYGRKELRFEVADAQPPQPLQATLAPPLDG